MSLPEYFDVLNINDNNENVDMVQSLLGADCLGTYFKNGTAKLYFNDGKMNDIEIQLQEICADFPFQWNWEKQKREECKIWWGRYKNELQDFIKDSDWKKYYKYTAFGKKRRVIVLCSDVENLILHESFDK